LFYASRSYYYQLEENPSFINSRSIQSTSPSSSRFRDRIDGDIKRADHPPYFRKLSRVGGDFQESWTILTILASLMVTYSIGDIIYTQVLIPMKKEKIYLTRFSSARSRYFYLSLGIICFQSPSSDRSGPRHRRHRRVYHCLFAHKNLEWTGHAVFNLTT
jgi:hypothetical protein